MARARSRKGKLRAVSTAEETKVKHIDELLGDRNRIREAVDRVQKHMAQRIADGLCTREQVDAQNSTLNLEMDDFCTYQEVKSLVMVHGRLTELEATYVYGLLGQVPDHFNRQPFEVKYVLTQLLAELVAWRIKLTGGNPDVYARGKKPELPPNQE